MRPCVLRSIALVMAVWAVVLPGVAWAHVAPAINANNRYLRITPMRDRVRLAYTVYVGEVPGAKARVRMDVNRDGAVSEDESRGYGDDIATQVRASLTTTIDRAAFELGWSEIHVGMGTPTTRAGSFSIDLIGWICAGDAGEHHVSLFDRYRIPLPGETEIKIQNNPGIDIVRASLGDEHERAIQLELKWRGNDGPLSTKGLFLDYAVDLERATRPPGDACSPPEEPVVRTRNWPLLLGLLGVACLSLIWFIRRRLAR